MFCNGLPRHNWTISTGAILSEERSLFWVITEPAVPFISVQPELIDEQGHNLFTVLGILSDWVSFFLKTFGRGGGRGGCRGSLGCRHCVPPVTKLSQIICPLVLGDAFAPPWFQQPLPFLRRLLTFNLEHVLLGWGGSDMQGWNELQRMGERREERADTTAHKKRNEENSYREHKHPHCFCLGLSLGWILLIFLLAFTPCPPLPDFARFQHNTICLLQLALLTNHGTASINPALCRA